MGDVLAQLFGAIGTIAGPSVTPATAMRVPAVAAAVTLIAVTCATLPAKVFRRQGDGSKSPEPTDPAYVLVHDDANPWTSASKLREQLTIDALLHGNGFAFANRVRGRVVELIRLEPTAVTVECDPITSEPTFKLTQSGGGQRMVELRDMVWLPCIGGTAPIKLAREAIALAAVLEQHASRLFGCGGRPSGLLKFPHRLGAEVAARIRDSWQATHAGENSGKTAVLEEGGDFVPLAFNSVDSQFEQMRKFQIEEIARAFRVPTTFIGDLSRGTWSNVEQLNAQFLQFTMLPWLRQWEAAYRRVFIAPDQRDSTTIEFITDDLLRADTSVRAEAYSKFRSMGVMTANEVRARENLPALPGGDVLQNPFTTSPKPSAPNAE